MTDPHINPQTGVWDDNYYNSTGKYGGNPQSAAYGSYTDSMNNGLQNYLDQQQGFYNTQFNNDQNLLKQANTQALGTQAPNAQQAFLSSVLNPQQAQQGSIEYGYNLGQNNENATYGLSSTANQQNRDLALNKLANDENWANQSLNLNQGNQNASTIDSLNGRGLLYGQAPTGAHQGQAMGGMTGAAGEQAGLVNTDFGNQRGQLNTTYGLNQQGVNQGYTQQQNMLDQTHQFNTNENQFNAANSVNQQNNQFAYNNTQQQNQLAQYKASLDQQQRTNQQQIKTNAMKMFG